MWKAIKILNGDVYYNEDIMIGGGGSPNGPQQKNAEKGALNNNNAKIKKPKTRSVAGELTSYPDGYWVVRWIDEVQNNEFGPVSP